MKPTRTVTSLSAAALAVAFACAASAAHAIDMPKRKSGLWEIKSTMKGHEGMARPPAQHCIDEKSDNLMRQSAKDDGSCATKTVSSSANKYVMQSVCKMGGTTATSNMVFSGKFDSNYRGEIHTKYDPPMMGMKEADMLLEAKWVGPCKPGMKPGDIIVPGMPAGMPNINMNEIMKRQQ